MKTWYSITNKGPDCTEVMIFDEVSAWGVSAESFCKQLSAISTKTITLRLNSPGGNVFDGVAIFNALKDHPATVNVKVEGFAASIAAVIAMAGDTVTIGANAFMMIHNAMSYAWGYAKDLRKEADLLDKISGSIAGTIAERTGQTIDDVKKKMEEETWFDAQEAQDFGLVDSIAGDDDDEDVDNAAFVRAIGTASVKYAKLPDRLRRIAANAAVAHHKPPTTPSTETTMATKIISRDGKYFVNINGTEHEVDGAAPAQPNNAATFTQADIDKARQDGETKARAYATDFDTAVNAAGMNDETKKAFREKFYGKDMEVIKFMVTNFIAQRTQPVGEGGAAGAPAGDPAKGNGDEIDKKNADEAGKRFDSDRNVRRAQGRFNQDPASEEYKKARERYVNGHVSLERDIRTKTRSASAAA